MSSDFRLKVVTPAGGVFDDDVAAVTSRSEVGEFCMLPEHCRLLTALEPGRLVIVRRDGAVETFVTDEGFLEGGADHASVIVQRCVAVGDIDEAAVKREAEEARAALAKLAEEDPERAEQTRALRWAEARLEAVSARSC
jgi:F-type H+-transporting ATPase subunit epsilon